MIRGSVFIVWACLLYSCTVKPEAGATQEPADSIPRNRVIHGLLVKGKVTDNQTRCSHYHTDLDIIAIKFKCCDTYYPCFSCHKETADHEPTTWEMAERDQKAILCGVCGHELTINEYMGCDNTCTSCKSSFNPNCKKHYDLYFAMD